MTYILVVFPLTCSLFFIFFFFKDIAYLQSLEKLVLANNKLASFSRCLCSCENLREVDLSNNKIRIIPKEIVLLTKLEDLLLSYNNIQLLTFNFSRMKNLKSIDLYHNEIIVLPADLCKVTDQEITLKYACKRVTIDNAEIKRLVKVNFGVQCIRADEAPLPLKELSCRVIGRINFVELSNLPNSLSSIIKCCSATCYECKRDIYCSAYCTILKKGILGENEILIENAETKLIFLFCSLRCAQISTLLSY